LGGFLGAWFAGLRPRDIEEAPASLLQEGTRLFASGSLSVLRTIGGGITTIYYDHLRPNLDQVAPIENLRMTQVDEERLLEENKLAIRNGFNVYVNVLANSRRYKFIERFGEYPSDRNERDQLVRNDIQVKNEFIDSLPTDIMKQTAREILL
jgi:hypothetical protein